MSNNFVRRPVGLEGLCDSLGRRCRRSSLIPTHVILVKHFFYCYSPRQVFSGLLARRMSRCRSRKSTPSSGELRRDALSSPRQLSEVANGNF